ncbi:hypothetical protein [Aquimarina intermedia]|uniref:Uncharacterized protein n=1 Tax=Aquimarina intermedia TaxID=350814 RepID=A0A5S5BS10_9FLAO|nr:hypothetical protein [Aquimarina intermedia]TYP69971.1 hypothetical protein BD809_11536 [Aquimarina intermedia]
MEKDKQNEDSGKLKSRNPKKEKGPQKDNHTNQYGEQRGNDRRRVDED